MSKRLTCVACDLVFNSYRAYQCHRVAHRCLSVPAMQAKGMLKGKNGVWVSRRNTFFRNTSSSICGDRTKLIPG